MGSGGEDVRTVISEQVERVLLWPQHPWRSQVCIARKLAAQLEYNV